MLLIRDAQVDALAEDVEQRFVDRMTAHLEENFPELAAAMTTQALREQVEATLARALTYGIDNNADQCRFLSLAAAYGWDFDSWPEHEWMRPLLGPSSGGQGMQALMAECLRRLEAEEASS
jgi:hypothetical protein